MEKVNHHFGKPSLSRSQLNRYMNRDKDFFLNKAFMGRRRKIFAFGKNIQKGYFEARTVAYFATQAIYYLGYNQVFILGMDLSLSAGGEIRAYNEGNKPAPTALEACYERHIKPAFETARAFSEQENFQLYNLSPQSRLPDSVIPKLSFEEAVEMAGGLSSG